MELLLIFFPARSLLDLHPGMSCSCSMAGDLLEGWGPVHEDEGNFSSVVRGKGAWLSRRSGPAMICLSVNTGP